MAKNTTLDALNALSGQVPGLHQKALKQRQAAQDISLQKAIGAAPATGVTQQAAAPMATQQALAAGKNIIAQRQAAAQQAGAIAGDTLAERQRVAQAQLEKEKLDQEQEIARQEQDQYKELQEEEQESRQKISKEEIQVTEALEQYGINQANEIQIATQQQRIDLNRLGNDIKEKILDSRIRFEIDERGRKFMEDRQLEDWALVSAADKQDFEVKMTQIEGAHKKKELVMQHAQAQIRAALDRGYRKEKGDMDREQEVRLRKAYQLALAEAERRKNRAANRTARYQNGVNIVATAVAFIPGVGPAASLGVKTAGALLQDELT